METNEVARCPECGAVWPDGTTCQDQFHQMLFWENEYPGQTLSVHHLLVLSYHLQHPGLYSPDGLRHAIGLLVEFVERDVSPAEVRRRQRETVDSGQRGWAVTARPDAHGAYTSAPAWTMVAGDVVAGGADRYEDNIRAWAQSILDALRASGNLPTS